MLDEMCAAGIFMHGTLPPGVMGFPHPSISLCFGPFCRSPLTQIE